MQCTYIDRTVRLHVPTEPRKYAFGKLNSIFQWYQCLRHTFLDVMLITFPPLFIGLMSMEEHEIEVDAVEDCIEIQDFKLRFSQRRPM